MSVTVYTKPDCRQCDATKRWLDERGIDYKVEDAMDEGNLLAIKSLGLAAAPVVIVSDGEDLANDVYWAGFQPERLAAALLS